MADKEGNIMATKAQIKASQKYLKTHIKRYCMNFQKVADADIIASIEYAKNHGVTKRKWIRGLYEGRL